MHTLLHLISDVSLALVIYVVISSIMALMSAASDYDDEFLGDDQYRHNLDATGEGATRCNSAASE
jgi:hypothetical protein